MPIALSTLSLAACGGGGSDDENTGHANVRLLNLMSDVSSVDLATDDDAVWFSGVAVDALTDYRNVDNDTFTLELRSAGATTALTSQSQGFAEDEYYTLIAWGRAGAPQLWKLDENADRDDIEDGKGRVRVFGATSDIGLLDVYLTTEAAELADSTPLHSGVGEGAGTGYAALAGGSYRLRVTGAGDVDDLRLDISGVSVTAEDYLTLVLSAGSGGVLVHAALLPQQGSLTMRRNTKARLRVVAGVADRASVGVSWAGATVVGTYTSPIVGPYTLVAAGSQTLELRIGGTTVATETRSLSAGADYTLLVHGSTAAPVMALISDDNRLPSTSTRAKVRLVHGASTLGALTLAIDYAVVASDVALGAASSFSSVAGSSSARIDVSAADSSDAVYAVSEVNLQALGVYTVFVLGGNASPTGVLRKDR